MGLRRLQDGSRGQGLRNQGSGLGMDGASGGVLNML